MKWGREKAIHRKEESKGVGRDEGMEEREE